MPGTSPPRVLLLEDNPADARLIQEALKEVHSECRLDVVKDVDEGKTYLESVRNKDQPVPSVILLDMKVPGGRGTDLLPVIRDSSITKDVPCLMLTTSEWGADIDAAKQAGATSYYVKPRDLPSMLHFAEELEVFWLERNP